MKQFTALLWKEWFEVRVLLAVGLFVFFGLPLIGGLEEWIERGRFSILADMWLVGLGGVLAAFVAVGLVVRDMNGRVEEFWRSRPVSVAQWLLVKYIIGLAAVLVILLLPMLAELAVSYGRFDWGENRAVLATHPFLWIASYSLSFAIACLIRRPAHAAMLSVAALLLIYFLPTVLPPISFLGLEQLAESWHPLQDHIKFAAGMIAISLAALGIALLAARRDWRIESDRKLIYWSIGGSLLVLFSSAAFQVASNLPLIQKVEFQKGGYESVEAVRCDGTRGILITRRPGTDQLVYRPPSSQPGPSSRPGAPRVEYQPGPSLLRTFKLGASGIQFDPPIELSPHLAWWTNRWRWDHPDVIWLPGLHEVLADPDDFDSPRNQSYPELTTIHLQDGKASVETQSFADLAVRSNAARGFTVYRSGDRLYMLGYKLLTFDVADPIKPRLISTREIDWRSSWPESMNRDTFAEPEIIRLKLPEIAELAARQRLELGYVGYRSWQLDGDILTVCPGGHLTTYHLGELTDTLATFHRIGRYDPTPVQRLFGSYSHSIGADAGMVYDLSASSQLGGLGVIVFDVTGPRPRPAGHFAFPNEFHAELATLPDGRLIVAGKKNLYLLGPPPKR